MHSRAGWCRIREDATGDVHECAPDTRCIRADGSYAALRDVADGAAVTVRDRLGDYRAVVLGRVS
jgi:hypothetical protein